MQSILFQELRRFCRTLILFLDIFELRVMIKILANMSALKEIYWLPISENYYQWNVYFVIKLPIVFRKGSISVTTVNIFSYTYIIPNNSVVYMLADEL